MEEGLTKSHLEHLAKLARIGIEKKKEEKLLRDLQKIIDYFEELKTLDTRQVNLATGGTGLVNVARPDIVGDELSGRGRQLFPEEEEDYLKVPEVFQNKDANS